MKREKLNQTSSVGTLMSREEMKKTSGGDNCPVRPCIGMNDMGFYVEGWCSGCFCYSQGQELRNSPGMCLPDEA